jgi:hypothetical protein
MPIRDTKLAKEELRALLVLGIIGTLLSTREFLDINLGFGFHVSSLVQGMLSFWAVYLFLTVAGISTDVVRPRVARACAILAPVVFRSGLGLSVAVSLFAGTLLIMNASDPSLLKNLVVDVVLLIGFGLLTFVVQDAISNDPNWFWKTRTKKIHRNKK